MLKDVNLNVVSAEVDTVGTEAQDEFFVTYRVRSWIRLPHIRPRRPDLPHTQPSGGRAAASWGLEARVGGRGLRGMGG